MRMLESSIRETARALIEAFVANGGGDFVAAVAVPLPSTVFLDVLGLPKGDLDRLLVWKDAIMRDLIGDDPVKSEYAKTVMMPEFFGYFQEAIDARRAMEDPPEDVLTGMIVGELPLDGGRTMTDAEITNTLLLFVLAGLDTVTAALSLSVESLARDPALRQQLIDDPALMPNAVEEFLRYWSLVTTCRQANVDSVLQGQEIKAGDYVAICTAAASRDPKEFANPHELDFRRPDIRHLAFGAGPHRCLGSHLARLEMAIALEEVLRAMPDLAVAPGTVPKHHFGGVLGCDELMLAVEGT
jgi:cytochrome P450